LAVEVNRYVCGYCGMCVSVCPVNALELVEMWLEVKNEDCVDCGTCVKVCPVGALKVVP